MNLVTQSAVILLGLFQLSTSSAPDLHKLVADGERSANKGDSDAAIEAFMRAETCLDQLVTEAELVSLLKQVTETLSRIDSIDSKRHKNQAKAGQRYLDLASNYQSRGWHGMTRVMLRAAQDVNPIYGVDRRDAQVQVYSTPVKGLEDLEASEIGAWRQGDLLQCLKGVEDTPGWVHDVDGVHSHEIVEGQSAFLIASLPSHGDSRLSVEMQFDSQVGSMPGFTFGSRGWSDHYIADLWTYPAENRINVRIWHLVDNQPIGLADVGGPMKAERMSDWNEFRLEIEGYHVRATFAGITAEAECATLPHGGIGLYVAGASESKKPVGFRNLRIIDLAVEDHLTLPSVTSEDGQEVNREFELRISIAARELQIDAIEDGVLSLLQVVRDLPLVTNHGNRRALMRTVEKLLKKHDPNYSKRKKAAKAASVALIELGRAHLKQDRKLTAAFLAERAARHHP